VPSRPRCIVLYFYYFDPAFGLLHIRLPTWFPFALQVYVNGHQWLARQITKHAIGFAQKTRGSAVWKRMLAAAAGFILLSPGADLVGANLGFKEMLKSLAPQMGLLVAMLLVGLSNPLTWIPVLLVAGLVQGLLKAKSSADKIKAKVVEGMINAIREKTTESAESMGQQVSWQTKKIVEMVGASLEKEIQSVRDQVEAVLETIQAGESRVQAKLKVLAVAETQARQLVAKLADLVFMNANPAKG